MNGQSSKTPASAPRNPTPQTSIDVLVCTFKRPHVGETLTSIDAQVLPSGVTLAIVVADNDDTPSGRRYVEACANEISTPVTYVHAPARNISLARNACLDTATADWVAFIDDDETANPDWLAKLLETATRENADAVFGPSFANYDPETPQWIVDQDHHSNIPKSRGDVVETGHTCNALMRRLAPSVSGERFTLARGNCQGEDTEFFFRLHQNGAHFALAPEAIVTEPVDPSRLSYAWIASRKFGAGQAYSFSANTPTKRAVLFLSGAAKAALSGTMALVHVPWQAKRNYWALRATFHCGTAAGCLKLKETRLYGKDT